MGVAGVFHRDGDGGSRKMVVELELCLECKEGQGTAWREKSPDRQDCKLVKKANGWGSVWGTLHPGSMQLSCSLLHPKYQKCQPRMW